MAVENKYGRKLITILVDGQEVRPREAVFVVRDPQGKVAGTLASDVNLLDDIAKAARSYWKDESEAIRMLNGGYRIELTTMAALLGQAGK